MKKTYKERQIILKEKFQEFCSVYELNIDKNKGEYYKIIHFIECGVCILGRYRYYAGLCSDDATLLPAFICEKENNLEIYELELPYKEMVKKLNRLIEQKKEKL